MKSVARVMDVVHRLSPRCREAARVISRSADERPPLLDRVGVVLHVLICTPCRRYRQSIEFLKRKMKQITDLPPLDPTADPAAQAIPPEVRSRLRAVLEAAGKGDRD